MIASIQGRILALALTAVLAVGLATVWLAYERTVHEVDELVDAQLVQYARIMLALGSEGDDDEVDPPDIHGHRYGSRLIFQLWEQEHGDQQLILRSPEAPLAWPEGVPKSGYANAEIGGVAWRSFAAAADDRRVLVGLDLDIRDELANDIAWGNLKPYLIGLPILALLLVWAIRRGLAPLRRMEAELARRSPERLDALPDQDLPRELNPLVRTMNRLFGRMARALDNERRFTSDASHELRTPLAAMKAQLQVAQRSADDDERGAAIAKALRGADRMAHLVAQLLSLARLDGAGDTFSPVPVPFSELVAESVAEFGPVAAAKAITFEADIQPGLTLQGQPDLLRVLVRNLLDNALRYTVVSGQVEATLAEETGMLVLRVRDNGPGLREKDLEKLGHRFHRFGAQTQEGAGLGLSIVSRVVTLHQGRLEYGQGLEGTGLGVTVTLPKVVSSDAAISG